MKWLIFKFFCNGFNLEIRFVVNDFIVVNWVNNLF